MNEKYLRPLIVVILIICCLGSVFFFLTFRKIEEAENASRCPPPVKTISESDLVGTWVAGVPSQSDTLIIKSDGTYKQVIHVASLERPTPINYESDWQAWYLEYSKDNIPYLHLKGMRFCGMNPGLSCEMYDGGGYDFCQDKYLPMNGEGILIALETLEEQRYALYFPLGSENSWIYDSQDH